MHPYGKDKGDRHPKVGKGVTLGAGVTVLGNIVVGDGAKIGASSVVIKGIPAMATAVGRCKLDPSLKDTCFQPLNLRVCTLLST